MKLKKIDFTKIAVKGTEWFSSLALLNLCWLLFSLPLVTLIPATDAVFDVLHDWETQGKSASVYQHFKNSFKTNFKKSFKLGLPIAIIIAVVFVDLYFLSQLTITSVWFQVLKYAFYTFSFLVVLAILYTYPLMKQTGESHIRLFVMGLLVAVGNPLTTLAVIAILTILGVVFLLWPGMLFFFAMSSVAYLMIKAVASIYQKQKENQTA